MRKGGVGAYTNTFEKIDHLFVPEVVGAGKLILWGHLKWEKGMFAGEG